MAKLEPGRILVWDIETSDFKANFGHMLMWAGKFVGEDQIYSMRIDENPDYNTGARTMIDDKRIVLGIRDLLESADAIVHHYGDRFDLPFVNTRCLEWGELPPAATSKIDTWRVARQNLAMTSNRLGVLAESFGGDNQKGGLSKNQWKLAHHGDKEVLDAMMEYCIQDVRATEAIYLAMRPLIWNHPVMHTGNDEILCPACGSEKTHGNGTRRTKHQLIYRQRCTKCGTGFIRRREAIK